MAVMCGDGDVMATLPGLFALHLVLAWNMNEDALCKDANHMSMYRGAYKQTIHSDGIGLHRLGRAPMAKRDRLCS